MISITGLSHNFGGAPILDEISLTIPKGGVTALVGANGAGKSTLLSLISRLMPIQTGEIIVDDLTVGSCDNDVLARKLSILSQSNNIAPRLTVQELVSFGRYPYHKGRPDKTDHIQIDETIATFELDEFRHRALDTLSGGQQQRAQIAMIFAQDTSYMLLDEPLNNLDIATSRSLMQLIQRLATDHKRTIVMVLHDINYASAYADHMVTLIKGRLGVMGHPGKIVSSDMLSKVFGTDAEVYHMDGQPMVRV